MPISVRAEQQKPKVFINSDDIPEGELPRLDLLDASTSKDKRGFSPESLEALSRQLEIKLNDFGITAEVVSVLPGPWLPALKFNPLRVSKLAVLPLSPGT